MDIWLTFAFINKGKVENIASYLYTGYTEANEHAKAFCNSKKAIAVEVTHIPVTIGDTYENGVFYHDGEEVPVIPTVEQQTTANTTDIVDINSVIDDLIIAITPTQEA